MPSGCQCVSALWAPAARDIELPGALQSQWQSSLQLLVHGRRASRMWKKRQAWQGLVKTMWQGEGGGGRDGGVHRCGLLFHNASVGRQGCVWLHPPLHLRTRMKTGAVGRSSRDSGLDPGPLRPGQQLSDSDLQSLCTAGRLNELLDVLEKRATAVPRKLYSQMMRQCGQMRALDEAKRLHAHLAHKWTAADANMGSEIVDMYVSCGSLVDAEQAQKRLRERSEPSWSSLIAGYAEWEQYQEALRTYQQMRREGVKPSVKAFLAALKACTNLRELEMGRDIHTHVLDTGNGSDTAVLNAILEMYTKCGSMADARRLFEDMPKRNASWNSMILGYGEQGEGEAALQVYERMVRESVRPDAQTFTGALRACICLADGEEVGETGLKVRSLERGRGIHSDLLQNGFKSNVFLANLVVDLYARCGSMVEAQQVFDNMLRRSLVTWNALIAGYAQQRQLEQVLKNYALLRKQGLAANGMTYVNVLRTCASNAALESGREIHAQIRKSELGTAAVATAVVDMYARCGSMQEARSFFDGLAAREAVTWSALIAGYGRLGDSQQVLALFDRMKQEGVEPDSATFLSLLTACSHAGLLEQGLTYFRTMSKDYGIAPTSDHYSCTVDLFCRAGKLDDAMALVEQMPVKPSLCVWRSLLLACRQLKNVELARRAFDNALSLDATDASAYLLMSDIYADAGMWEDRDVILAMRDEAGAVEPGQSWIEIGGKVHKFVVGDGSHTQSQDIFAEIKNMQGKIKEGFASEGLTS